MTWCAKLTVKFSSINIFAMGKLILNRRKDSDRRLTTVVAILSIVVTLYILFMSCSFVKTSHAEEAFKYQLAKNQLFGEALKREGMVRKAFEIDMFLESVEDNGYLLYSVVKTRSYKIELSGKELLTQKVGTDGEKSVYATYLDRNHIDKNFKAKLYVQEMHRNMDFEFKVIDRVGTKKIPDKFTKAVHNPNRPVDGRTYTFTTQAGELVETRHDIKIDNYSKIKFNKFPVSAESKKPGGENKTFGIRYTLITDSEKKYDDLEELKADIKKIDAKQVKRLEVRFSPIFKGKEKYANITYSYVYDKNADGEELQQEKENTLGKEPLSKMEKGIIGLVVGIIVVVIAVSVGVAVPLVLKRKKAKDAIVTEDESKSSDDPLD